MNFNFDIINLGECMNNQSIHELIPFNTACDEFILGKYILADIKIASILKIIADDEKLKNIISSCIDDYDFNAAFSLASKENNKGFVLTLPTNEKEIIAFVYNLLYRFDNKVYDFYDFCTGCLLCGHNAIGFDFKFIKKAAEKAGLHFKNQIIDTLILARTSSLRLANYKLGTIVSALGLTLEGAHRAYNDAFATAQVLLGLCKIKK